MLNLGWVDFSKSDRDMVLSVLRQLTEPGAVDELGIGTIRDGFSDILFPGTSTIQTRAKYLFIIPYLCLELERERKLSPREFIEALEQRELNLIDILAVNGAEGVIGQRSRQTLRRKPSSVYWSALRTFGLLSEAVTMSEYAALQFSRKSAAEQQKTSGRRQPRDDEETSDDKDVGRNGGSPWRVPASEGWRDDLTINLTAEEAIYLREKITTMPGTRDSLFALVLRENRLDFVEYDDLNDLDVLQSLMTPELRRDYQLARDFSRFIFGARIRYNVIFSDGQNEPANEKWRQYSYEKPSVNLDEIRVRLKTKPEVMRFLKRFEANLDNETALDKLIKDREIEIKTRARAKLTNKELYNYEGNSINMVPLVYRLPDTQRIVRDIFEGVSANA